MSWLFRQPEPEVQSSDPDFRRGTAIFSIQEALARARKLPRGPSEPLLCWGGIPLPEHYSDSHFLLLGPTGSGKTVSLRLLLQSIVPRIRPGSGLRAIIYDPKNEFWEILSGMPLHAPVVTLHPYDTRSFAWDIAADITDRSTAQSLAATFIPNPGGQNKFFYDAAQALFSAVMEAFIILVPRKWTLRDVLLVLEDTASLKRLLQQLPETRPTYTEYFGRELGKTLEDILVTVSTETTRLKPVAALWSHSHGKVSLKDWASDSYILLLATDKEIGVPLDNVNRVLFQRISQIFTKQGTGRTWVFVDEAKYAGNIPGLDDLLTTGRSFETRVCLATQDLSGFRATYGPDRADEILGSTGNKAFFGSFNPATAKYISAIMGQSERTERSTSISKNPHLDPRTGWGTLTSTSTNEHIVQRDSVLPEQLMQLRPANRQRFYGYYATQAIGRYEGWLHHDQSLYPRGPEPRFLQRPSSQQYAPSWTEADARRLGPDLARLVMQPLQHEETDSPGSHLDDITIPDLGLLH